MTDYKIWPSTTGPTAADPDASNSQVSLGVEFYVTSTCWLKAIRFWNPSTGNANTASRTVRLYQVVTGNTGTLVATKLQPVTATLNAWNEIVLDTPVQLTINQRYRAIVTHPSVGALGYATTAGYFASGGAGASNIVNGPLVCVNAANATGGFQGSYVYSSSGFTTASFNGANYWSDVVVSDTDPAAGATSGSVAANATTATQTAGTWTNPTNATGADNAAFASWVNAVASTTATLTLAGFGTFSSIPAGSQIDSITVRVKGYSSSSATTPISSITSQLYDGATPIGTAVTHTKSTTTTNVYTTFNVTGVTLAQLQAGTLAVRHTATRANSTTSATVFVDSVQITANWSTPVVAQGYWGVLLN